MWINLISSGYLVALKHHLGERTQYINCESLQGHCQTFSVCICAYFFFLAMPHGMWDLSSPTRDRTCAPCSGSMKSQPLDGQGSPTSVHFYLVVIESEYYDLLFVFNSLYLYFFVQTFFFFPRVDKFFFSFVSLFLKFVLLKYSWFTVLC